MAFWSDLNGSIEPLRSNRWFIRFGDSEQLDLFVFGLKECAKPSYDISVTEHTHINGHVFRNPGILKWKPITMKFASVTHQTDDKKQQVSLAQKLNTILYTFGYKNIFSDVTQDILKSNFQIPSVEIIQLNPSGGEQEIWTLYNPFISNINYGNLSYASDDIVDITLTMQYDYADHKDK